MEERIIQFGPFLANRANEIAQLQNTVKSKFLNCTAQPFQVIHKHMRRRAMSHNRYRIPSQLRKKMGGHFEEKELQQKIPRCRKHLRKRKDFIFMRRSNKVLWMETHLYQVKRMKMIIYNGFKVAEKANEKNFRAVHRYFDHGSMIFDASFYQIVEGVAKGLVVDEHTIAHPQQLEDTEFFVHKNQFNIFQLIGREALQSINQLLNYFGCQIDGKTQKYFNFNYEYSKLQSLPMSKGRKLKTLDDYDKNMSNMNDVLQNIGEEDIQRTVWLVDKEQFMKRFKIDTRVRYTHQKAKRRLYQLLKKPEQVPKEQVPVDLMKKKRAMRWLLKEMDKNENEQSMEIEEQKPQTEEIQKPIKEEQKIVPKIVNVRMVIIPPTEQPLNSIDIGYKIVINMGAGLLIWRLFNQLKVKPIGLRDIRQLSLENNLQFYDYEDEDLFEKYLVSTNKLNYLSLQFPYPFSFDFSMYSSWSTCQLLAYKNVPEKQALIFQPLEEDFELLKQGIYNIQVQRTEDEKPKISNRLELLQYEKTLAQIKLSRKILGIVQFGNISLQYGKGMGKGQIDSKFSKKKIIVLFRNHNSEYYFFADCIIN